MYKVRVRAPGGVWSRWANWSTTDINTLMRESLRSRRDQS